MTKIHVWIGMSTKNREEFSQYFAINQIDRDAGIGASQFDKDVNIKWYDDDLIGVYYSETDDLEQALDELPTSPDAIDQIQSRCAELKIDKANAMFYYEDAELEITEPTKKYNELTYIGVFDNT
jgi:hypothetical protein